MGRERHNIISPFSNTLLLASSSSSEIDSKSKAQEDSPSSSSSKPRPNSPPKNKVKVGESKVSTSTTAAAGESKNTNTTAATATKTPKVTRIASKSNNVYDISNNSTTSVEENNIYSDDDESNKSSTIQGLISEKSFNLLTRIHCTLTLLRKHFPTLLELPALSPSNAKWIYDSNVTVTGPGGEQLAEGLEEVLLLTRALATAATAARRAGSLFDLAVGSSSSSSQKGQPVECELLIDPNNPLKVMVLWRTRLPSIGILSAPATNSNREDGQSSSSTSSYTGFSGRSTVDLCPDNGIVTNLQINEVKINGVALIESLGTALAAVRRAARTAMATSSIFDNIGGEFSSSGSGGKRRSSGNPLLDGLLNGIQDVASAVDALPSSEEAAASSLESPLYVVPKQLWEGAAFPVNEGLVFNTTSENIGTNSTATSSEQTFVPVPIDQYAKSGQIPLAGSKAFVEYAISHNALQRFAKYGIHQLAGESDETVAASVSTENIRALFTTDAELVTLGSTSSANEEKDYITLISGAGKLTDLYSSLSLFRATSGGDWSIDYLQADLKTRRLIVSWRSESPLKIEGTDNFIFEPPSLASPYRLPLISDGDKVELAVRCSSYFNSEEDDEIPLKISRIENLKLKVAGVTADSAWISRALRTGIADNTPLPDATLTELLRSLTKKKPSAKKTTGKKETPKDSSMPSLDDAAAVAFYGILRSLHNDLPNIANTGGDGSSPIPVGEFLAETVELRGLLGEVLMRGSANYRRLIGLAMSSLRASMQTKAVRLAATPRPTVEVTPKGSIKVNLVLALWVAPQLPLGGAVGQSKDGNQGFGVPLKIEVSSEYIVDNTGSIREHRILESRLNGVLTPGDVFSRWIKGLTREDDDSSKFVPSAIDSLMDAITWVRSMQERK